MNKKITTKGLCTKCNESITQRNAFQHIHLCHMVGMKEANSFIIKVVWPHKNPIYWLYLSVPFKATLEDLDYFLRDIWLECCSHLSQFTINGDNFVSDFGFEDCPQENLSMDISCKNVLVPGMRFIHEYDFGSTTELLLEVVGTMYSKNKIGLLARNLEPEFKCSQCEEKATFIDPVEDNYLCEGCIDGEEEFTLPIVNSPRTGVCGYIG